MANLVKEMSSGKGDLDLLRLGLAHDCAGDGMWDIDMAGRCLYLGAGYYQLLGFSPDEVSDPWEFAEGRSCDKHLTRAGRLFSKPSTPGAAIEFEYRMRHRDGHWVWFHSKARVVSVDGTGVPTRIIGINRDITTMRAREGRIRRQAQLIGRQVRQLAESNGELDRNASTDALTGLLNRRAFLSRLKDACRESAKMFF